jgi:Na+/H+ antiporter NhaC
MFQLSIICVMIGGMVGLIRHHGGITFILDQARRVISSARGAELGIATLTALINAAIANNTITIIITGPIAREIADRYHLDRRRSASIMDTISCTVQGMLPYGAQLLAALSIASYQVKPSAVISHMYYPLMVGVATLLVILLGQYKLPILGIGISKKKKR